MAAPFNAWHDIGIDFSTRDAPKGRGFPLTGKCRIDGAVSRLAADSKARRI